MKEYAAAVVIYVHANTDVCVLNVLKISYVEVGFKLEANMFFCALNMVIC